MQAIIDGSTTMTEGILSMPIGWMIWVNWMVVLNTGAILFAFRHPAARVIFVTFLLNGAFMTWLAGTYGYVRLLGLSHIVFWSPLLIYLIMKYRSEDFERASLFGRYVLIVILTNTASLVIDWIDVIRYVAGERGPA